MLKIESTEVFGFAAAFRGVRNPLESWAKSDSKYPGKCEECSHFSKESLCKSKICFEIGENDMNLAKRLIKGGTEHRKFLRQIFVSVDIIAPIYWWKEFDTYKVGTVANSTSTMHKLCSNPITAECFSFDSEGDYEKQIIEICESLRCEYLALKDTEPAMAHNIWRKLVQILPEAWIQTRTCSMNYEVLRTMYHQRKNHKLTEWSVDFCDWVKTLPYATELIMED